MKAVRLYRFYNIALSKHGEPFALCDKHAKEQLKAPAVRDGSVHLQKIADKAVRPCDWCEA